MPIVTRRPKSMPSICSRKPWTKCWRASAPSVTISVPSASCPFRLSNVASRFASSSASPSSRQGAHNLRGSASQAGFGRLPAIVVSSIPALREDGEKPVRTSAAVEDVVAEVLHLEDRGVRAPDDRLAQVGLDDLADDDVMVALLDDAGHPALDRRRGGIEDRRPGRALVNGLAA